MKDFTSKFVIATFLLKRKKKCYGRKFFVALYSNFANLCYLKMHHSVQINRKKPDTEHQLNSFLCCDSIFSHK